MIYFHYIVKSRGIQNLSFHKHSTTFGQFFFSSQTKGSPLSNTKYCTKFDVIRMNFHWNWLVQCVFPGILSIGVLTTHPINLLLKLNNFSIARTEKGQINTMLLCYCLWGRWFFYPRGWHKKVMAWFNPSDDLFIC